MSCSFWVNFSSSVPDSSYADSLEVLRVLTLNFLPLVLPPRHLVEKGFDPIRTTGEPSPAPVPHLPVSPSRHVSLPTDLVAHGLCALLDSRGSSRRSNEGPLGFRPRPRRLRKAVPLVPEVDRHWVRSRIGQRETQTRTWTEGRDPKMDRQVVQKRELPGPLSLGEPDPRDPGNP